MGGTRGTDPRAQACPNSWSIVRVTMTATIVLSLLVVAMAPAAFAAPRDEALSRAADVKREVDELDEQTEILSEEYNAARERHADLVEQERAAAQRLKETTERTDLLQARLSTRAQSLYRNGRSGFIEVILGVSDFEAFAQTWDILQRINQEDARTIAELKAAKAEQAQASRVLEERAAQAAAELTVLATRQADIEAMLSDRKRLLSGLEAEVAALDRAEEERRAAEAARLAASRIYLPSRERSFPPPTTAARSEVVAIAKRYLGAPYVWGASGPNSFDCSGFTSFVFRQVGVQLPRVSRDQINSGQRVSRGDLQPGDLVFFGSPIHHVGIYVGDDMMIHSPRTGDVVKISPLLDDYVGACRP